LTQPKNVDCNH